VVLRALYPASWRWVVMSDNIQGFLSAAEGDALYGLARDFTPQENAVVVELGSWKGKSSVMIAGGLLAGVKEAPRLFCVARSDATRTQSTSGSITNRCCARTREMSRLFSEKTSGAAGSMPLCRRSRATHSNAVAIGHNRSISYSSMRITNIVRF
jgi:hypothetical protein